jgi:predicted AAA+ superfamily ATPase
MDDERSILIYLNSLSKITLEIEIINMTTLPHFKRQITGNIEKRLRSGRLPLMQVVLGPRQVGKTTGIWQAVQSLKYPYHSPRANKKAQHRF